MDIQHLVDRLEDLIDEGRHFPMSKYTLIDEERVLSIIDQMRISVPEQIETAARVVAQRDRLLAQANEEATRIVEYAKQKSEEMVDHDGITVAAQHQARAVIDQAQIEADRVRNEADAYVVEVLRELESHLLRTLTIVRNGIAKVVQDREAAIQMRSNPPQQIIQAQPQPASMPIHKRQEVSVDADTPS